MKSLWKKSRPQIAYSQRKSLNANDKAYLCRVVKHLKMVRSNECTPKGVPIMKFFSMKKPPAKNIAPKLHPVSHKALMPAKTLITVVWSNIKRWRDQMNAPQLASQFWIFFQWKAFGKSPAPKLYQVSEKALMPPKKLINVVWSSIKRLRDQMNAPQQVFPLWNFFQKGQTRQWTMDQYKSK